MSNTITKNTTEIAIKPTISFIEYKAICDNTINAVFQNGDYLPEFLDMMTQYYTIIAYTEYDFGIESINVENINKIYEILNSDEMIKVYTEITKKPQFCSSVHNYSLFTGFKCRSPLQKRPFQDTIHRQNAMYCISTILFTLIILWS